MAIAGGIVPFNQVSRNSTVLRRGWALPDSAPVRPGGEANSGLSRRTGFEFNPGRMEASEHARRSGSRPASRRRTPTAFRICDGVTEGLLYVQAVFAPWAFGTTERWSIWTMNAAGYGLGGSEERRVGKECRSR